jgi:hypothetical protein
MSGCKVADGSGTMLVKLMHSHFYSFSAKYNSFEFL